MSGAVKQCSVGVKGSCHLELETVDEVKLILALKFNVGIHISLNAVV